MLANKSKVGIVIPSYNRLDNIKLALSSLSKQTFTNFFVIIADDGSTDNTRHFLSDLKKTPFWQGKLSWIGCGIHDGFRAARTRNIGFHNLPTSCDLILFIDSDVVLETRFLEQLNTIHLNHPEAIILGRTDWLLPASSIQIQQMIDNNFENSYAFVPSGSPKRIQGTFCGREIRKDLPDNPFKQLDRLVLMKGHWLMTLNVAMPRNIFNLLRGFDENMVGYGYEDIEFGIRVEQMSFFCIVTENFRAYHVWHAKKSSKNIHEENQRNLHYVLIKHGYNPYLYNEVDWKFLFHYHVLRDGKVYKNEKQIWAVNKTSDAKILLKGEQVSELGFVESHVFSPLYPDLSKVKDFSVRG